MNSGGKCFFRIFGDLKVGGLGLVEWQEGRVAFLFEEAFYGLRWVWCVCGLQAEESLCFRAGVRAAFSRRDCWELRRSPRTVGCLASAGRVGEF